MFFWLGVKLLLAKIIGRLIMCKTWGRLSVEEFERFVKWGCLLIGGVFSFWKRTEFKLIKRKPPPIPLMSGQINPFNRLSTYTRSLICVIGMQSIIGLCLFEVACCDLAETLTILLFRLSFNLGFRLIWSYSIVFLPSFKSVWFWFNRFVTIFTIRWDYWWSTLV